MFSNIKQNYCITTCKFVLLILSKKKFEQNDFWLKSGYPTSSAY